MAKMTAARVERWHKDLAKARELVAKTSRDVGNAKLTTSGSIYSNVIHVGGSIAPVLTGLESLTSEDVQRSGIERIKQIVVEAAERRKAAKAAKEAERAAVGAA